MREVLFTSGNRPAWEDVDMADPAARQHAQDRAGLHRAINLAIESAFSYGIDLPVGAVALEGDTIVGRGFANDQRFGQEPLHAEVMALYDTKFDVMKARPDTLVSTLEPCVPCQLTLTTQPGLQRVAFGLDRQSLSDRGLVRAKTADIYDQVSELPYEVVKLDDEALLAPLLILMDHVKREPATGGVSVDRAGLHRALVALQAS